MWGKRGESSRQRNLKGGWRGRRGSQEKERTVNIREGELQAGGW